MKVIIDMICESCFFYIGKMNFMVKFLNCYFDFFRIMDFIVIIEDE